MDKHAKITDDSFAERFGELACKRAEVVEAEFPETRLKMEFGLNIRESLFVKAYCVSFNATKSALFAGYSPKNADKGSWNFFGSNKIIAARDAILKAVSSATQMQRLALAEKCVAKLSSIIDMQNGAVAVAAIESLRKFIENPPVKIKEDLAKHEVVTDEEIEASLRRSGVLS